MRYKILYLLFLFSILSINLFSQTSTIRGVLIDQESQRPIKEGIVKIGDQEIKTDKKGVFEISNLKSGDIKLEVIADGYDVISEEYVLSENETKDVGTFVMQLKNSEISELEGISEIELDADDDYSGQYISGILQSSSDIFIATSGFVFSYAYFKMRGYDSEYTDVYMNGLLMNDAEDERASWSDWGGLNDVTRNKEVAPGISSSGFSFGNIGGSTNIITRPSMIRKQNKLTYSYTNRSYRQRAMYTYASGMMKNNTAIAFSASRRWAEEGYIAGTFYDQWAYFLAVERKFNNKHSLAFTGFSSPSRRGMQAGAVQEAYDLLDNNYYNPNWGFQEGEKRNSKVKSQDKPTFILSHYFTPNRKINITTSLGFMIGSEGRTSLNWYDAADPRPDYYRYLPNYQTDQTIRDIITNDWKTNPTISQINWDEIYQVNYLNSLEGKQAKYIIEERRDDNKQLSFSSLLKYYLNDDIKITTGIEFRKYTGYHYKTLTDMLDGTGNLFWVDIDQFAERDFAGNDSIIQNDLNNPYKVIKEGDRFGYDYNINNNYGLLWGQIDFNFDKFDIYFGAKGTYTQFWRDGNMKNGRAPENSYGESEKLSFTNYGIKGGVTYKITGRHYIVGNATLMTNPPTSRNSYISPRIKATVLPNLESETITAGDINYVARFPGFKARITAYQTYISNQMTVNSFYHDEFRTYVNYIMQGVDKSHQGLEIGADYKLTSTISLNAVAAYGDHRYISRPNATISFENGSAPDTSKTVYIKNFYVTGTPQTAGSFGIKYFHPKYWFFNANINYFGKSYLNFNPERRTERAIANLGEGDSLITVITEPMLLNDGFTLDASIGKSLKIDKYYINFNFSVSNILNNTELITGGFEQMRFDFVNKNVDKFPPKYYYGRGRTFYFNVSFRF